MLDLITVLQLYLISVCAGLTLLSGALVLLRGVLPRLIKDASNEAVDSLKNVLRSYTGHLAKANKNASKQQNTTESSNNSNDLLGNIIGSPMVQNMIGDLIKGFMTPPKPKE